LKSRWWEGGPTTKIHVDLPEDVHRKLRVKVALGNGTIQDYVQALVAADVQGVRVDVANSSGVRKPKRSR